MKRRDRTARPRSRFVSNVRFDRNISRSEPAVERVSSASYRKGVRTRSRAPLGARERKRGARGSRASEPFAPGPGRAVREGRMLGARVRPAPARGPGPAARAHDTLLQGAPRRSTTCSRWATSTAVSERSDIVVSSLTILAIFTGTTLPEAHGCFMRTSQRQTDASAS